MAEQVDNKIIWVQGNTQEVIIPLEQEIMVQEGEVTPEPYYPEVGDTITVTFVGKYLSYDFTPTVDGNNLIVVDNGTLPFGEYGIQVVVVKANGTRLRSMWDKQLEIKQKNDGVLQEWDEFKSAESAQARAALFFFAKGDKGDKGDDFEYSDFTPEEIAELQRPALEAKAECEEWLANHDVINDEEMQDVLVLNE